MDIILHRSHCWWSLFRYHSRMWPRMGLIEMAISQSGSTFSPVYFQCQAKPQQTRIYSKEINHCFRVLNVKAAIRVEAIAVARAFHVHQ